MRAGGRAARRALRQAPLEEALRPIRPGLKGGQYRPLSEEGERKIHEAALTALWEIGLSQAPDTGIEIMTKAGAVLGDNGRLHFPRSLVEDMVDKAARNITLYARDSEYDLTLSNKRTYFGTAGAAVHVVDAATGDYHPSTTQDLYQAAQLAQQLDNIHFFQRSMVCRDVEDPLLMDINTLYASCAGTQKHVGTSFSDPDNVDPCFDLIHMIAGDEAKWRARPFISNTNCFVVPPMRFATESCTTMEYCIRHGMPILLLSAGQAGATAPASLALAITQAVAECLAGVVYVNALSPGHPAIFGTWPFVSDLRTGAMSGGSAEQALLSAGCAQMHQFYDLPGGAAAGISDSKLTDMQAGWEQGITNVLAGLAGLNMVYEAAGMHASLLGFSLESLVLGDDILGQVLRCVRGIEVDDDTLNLDVIKSICLDGPGHYLGSDQTLSLMQKDYVYPTLGNRMSPKEWEEVNRPDLLQQAIQRKEALLEAAIPQLSPELDQAIRERWSIHCQ